MGLFISHVNVVLSKMRESSISSLSTDKDSVAYLAQIAVQRAIARVWNARQWTWKQRKTTLSLTSGDNEKNLPRDVGEPYLVLSSVSPYLLKYMSEDEFDRRDPNPTASGNPRIYTLFEHTGVEEQPSAASVISLVSSSASDTTQKVLVRGLVSSCDDYEEVSLNGLTTVFTTKSFSRVDSVSKSADTAGRVTLTVGATTLLTLGPLEVSPRIRKIRFFPEAGSSITATLKHYKAPVIPVNAYDASEIPTRWDYVVEQFAFALAIQSKGKDQADEAAIQFQLAEKYLNEDMSAEEKQTSSALIVPDMALDVGPRDGGLTPDLDDWGYEIN